MDMKTCTKCGIEKSLDRFQKAKGYKDGYQTWCKECKYANSRKWLKNHPENQEKAREAARRWYKESGGKEYHQQYRDENRDLYRMIDRNYKRIHKEELKERKRKRRFAYLDTDITLSWLRELRDQTTHCPLCGVELSAYEPSSPTHADLDHMIPLAVGGKHTMDNVRYICHLCNLKRPKDGSDYFLDASSEVINEMKIYEVL